MRSYQPDEIIAIAGEQCKNLMIIHRGKVRGDMVDQNGKVVTVEEIEAPRAIAPAFLFGEKNLFPVNVTTVTTCEIVYITRESFISLLQKDSRILINYLDLLSNRSYFLADKVKFHSLLTIRQKFARYLLENTRHKNCVAFDPQISQTAMAEMFGVARQSLSRTISELVEEQVIDYSPHWITVLNFDLLLRIINGEK